MVSCSVYVCLTLRGCVWVLMQCFCTCATLSARVTALEYIHERMSMLVEGEPVCLSVCVCEHVHSKCIMCVFRGQ